MPLHGFVAKAMPAVVTGVVGAAAYETLAKAPWRKATVVATAWGIRMAREAERKAGRSAEQARLTVADLMAEARERAGSEGAPLTVAGSGDDE
ncbi:hypothetical protein AWC03_01605 [Mycobacterium europaeum]|uniref:DUF1490 family protein n=1 Tax=Mycobacterium europaeum TaxID=761804 RepID=UPI000A151DDE|nr:DUF1490 family protein [Mycobacterium europaeum]ORV47007.1 hypothetical protein AWC03_01605 [Mycobacterium europaeum]